MRKSCIVFLCLSLLACESRNPSLHKNNLDYQNIDSYTSNAPLMLNGTNVSDQLMVNGDLHAANSHLNKVDVNGHSKIINSVIKGPLNTNGQGMFNKVSVLDNFVHHGNLTMKNSWVKKPFAIYGRKIVLKNTITQDIHIQPAKYLTTVELQDGTEIKGNIIFPSGQGKVYIDSSSKLHGRVLGGKTDQEKEEFEIRLKEIR